MAMVTGGGRGIGRSIVLALAARGFDVAFCFARNEAAAREVCEAAPAGARVRAFQADVALREDRARFLDEVLQGFGRVDLLVNNAGMGPVQRRDLLEATEESFDRVLATNLKGPYFLTQAVARVMLQQRAEHPDRAYRIVNIGSMSAYTASVNRGEYCISKAGMGMMTRLYAVRLAAEGIGVYEVRPGIIATDMTQGVRDRYEPIIASGRVPMRRWGTPDDVARAVVAIAQGGLPFSTGEVINVDGGFHLHEL
ncbi:3-ketoacyl-ACP reductase [Limnochorda pilosa]|uniref:3-ketoacyl-ACP reductase n=1 Tax=Limnochorda pilosa TaxID=1555112 RepID=A0A0K2SML2_LIMPI|nr:3-ketoacyl-ACP reductase [Limnochorda pilosa]